MVLADPDHARVEGTPTYEPMILWSALQFSGHKGVERPNARTLADGGYIHPAEPVLLIGDCGTEKTYLLTGLYVASCRQRRRVRSTTAATLVNELVDAKHQFQDLF